MDLEVCGYIFGYVVQPDLQYMYRFVYFEYKEVAANIRELAMSKANFEGYKSRVLLCIVIPFGPKKQS